MLSAKKMKLKKISIVIPVFCNESSLPTLFDSLVKLEKKLLNELSLELELIFIDDGSLDNSWNILSEFKKLRKKTKIIQLTRNFGGINAVKIGFSNVSGDGFTMLAADLQDPPDLIFSMAKHWKTGEKFIICERESRDDSFLKKFFSLCYYRLVRIFLIKNYPLGGFDLALMDKVFLPFLINSSKSTFPPILAFWLGFKPFVIKYKRRKRHSGQSTWSFSKRLNVFFDIFYGFSITPIRTITLLGLFLSLLSFIYAAILVYYKISHGISVEGFTTIVVMITFMFGCIILSLGIIGEYVWKVLNELNKRPDAVINKALL